MFICLINHSKWIWWHHDTYAAFGITDCYWVSRQIRPPSSSVSSLMWGSLIPPVFLGMRCCACLSQQQTLQCSPSKMAAEEESNSRAPCLNFSSPGPLGNAQSSNNAHSSPATNEGSAGATGGAPRTAGHSNPQPGPDRGGGTDVRVENSPNRQHTTPQSAGQSATAARAPTVAGGASGAATNMTASSVESPNIPSSLPSSPASAAVLVYREPVYNWQATKNTVKERFAFLFNNEVLSDVHFLVGKGMGVQRIPAHR